MIKLTNLSKSFDNRIIIENINITFSKSKIYGLLGTNGAGKSTLLRTISGIYKADTGFVTLEDKTIFENPETKSKILYIPDENIFLPRKNITANLNYLKCFYNNFNQQVYDDLQDIFELDVNKNINSFSKGMKKQAILLISLSLNPSYVILDETFDGLDPLIRVKVKKYLLALVEEKDLCIIVSTHSISDIENLADEVIILNDKSISYKKVQLEDTNKFYKVQLCFNEDIDISTLNLNIKKSSKFGSINTVIFENTINEIEEVVNPLNPLVFDICNLTLEETFMFEVEGF